MSFMEWVIEITDRTLRESRAHVLEAESFHRQRKEEMPKPWVDTAVGPRSPSSSETPIRAKVCLQSNPVAVTSDLDPAKQVH